MRNAPARRALAAAFALAAVSLAACGPKIDVKPIGTRVDPAPPPSTPAPAGAEAALPPTLPGAWRLTGGPAPFDAEAAAEPLGDEAGRFRGLVTYATAEYMNLAKRVIALEAFQMSSAETAATALGVGRPQDARAITGNDLDEAFTSGLRAEARKGTLIVRVRWFDAEDIPLRDAALEAMRDALAAGVEAGLAGVSAPEASPSPAPAATPAPTPSPAP